MSEIIVPKNSAEPTRAIYSPLVAAIGKAIGSIEVRRASHVEPGAELKQSALQKLSVEYVEIMPEWAQNGVALCKIRPTFRDKWWADMQPSGGGMLGPFDDNQAALKAETAWLKERNLPFCEPCGQALLQQQQQAQSKPPDEPVYTPQIEPPQPVVTLSNADTVELLPDGNIAVKGAGKRLRVLHPGEPEHTKSLKLFKLDLQMQKGVGSSSAATAAS